MDWGFGGVETVGCESGLHRSRNCKARPTLLVGGYALLLVPPLVVVTGIKGQRDPEFGMVQDGKKVANYQIVIMKNR